jgi:hypothetical protein
VKPEPRLVVEPSSALVDEAVAVRLESFTPGAPVALSATHSRARNSWHRALALLASL